MSKKMNFQRKDKQDDLDYYKELTEKLENIIQSSTDGLYVVDRNGDTILVNEAYAKMTGYKIEELLGKNVRDLTQDGYFNTSISKLIFEQQKQLSIIQQLGNPNKIGEKKEMVVTGTPIFDDGELSHIVISISDISELTKIKQELERAKKREELNHYHYSFSFGSDKFRNERFVFRSPKMRHVYEKVQQVAPFPTSILLYGASGVGKEVITDLIHHYSDRSKNPLIKINCGAIPEHLLESELFGYEKGAFTGAKDEGKVGLLELADKGTIMFDEIGEMPLNLQVKLLRVLQERQVQRLGSNQTKDVDIRIISATNRNLAERVQEGTFREDLYYRLNVVQIQVPSLKERPEDISELMLYFFDYFSKSYSMDKQLQPETIEILLRYPWPGNVRELRNMMEYLIVSINEDKIEPHHLPNHIIEHDLRFDKLSLKEQLSHYEKKIIADTVKQKGSIRQAAKQLGVHHTTLVKKMQTWE